MACCNQRRAQLASGPARAASRAATTSRSPAPPAAGQPGAPPGTGAGGSGPGGAEVQLRFTGARPVRVEGVISGRIYRASPAAPLLTARQEDVRSLLRTGYFVRH
jgi:hypothetical protein